MADWSKYEVADTSLNKWDKFTVNENINPTGHTSSPQDFLQEEMAKQKSAPMKFGFNPQQYFQQAQPAFKLALEHPETLFGKTISPDAINKTVNSDYADIYRRSGGGVLPGAQSKSMAGQMIPEIAGQALDFGTRPSTYIAPLALSGAAKLAANNPTTRRFLQTQLPTLSKGLLEANPMAPIYKEINGIQRDITKPLPESSEKLVNAGNKLVDAVHETMDNMGKEYEKVLSPFYKNKVDITSLPQQDLKDLGLISKDINVKNATVEDLWKARWDLMKMVGNPWKKEALLTKTSLSEDRITNLLTKMKATVLNNLPKGSREEIFRLDPQFEDAIGAGKGLLRLAHDPTTGKINTVRLISAFKNRADEGSRELFNRFSYYDKRLNEVTKIIKAYNTKESIKNFTKRVGVGSAIALAGYGVGSALVKR